MTVDVNDVMTKAIMLKDTARMRELFDFGFSFAQNKELGAAFLIMACSYRENHEAVRLLIEHGADVNFRISDTNPTPLMEATNHGFNESVHLLLQAGANPNELVPGEYLPLRLAIKAQHKNAANMVAALMDHGADLRLFEDVEKMDCLLLATYSVHGTDVTAALLEHGYMDRVENPVTKINEAIEKASFHQRTSILDVLNRWRDMYLSKKAMKIILHQESQNHKITK